jgi:hypothetical protein
MEGGRRARRAGDEDETEAPNGDLKQALLAIQASLRLVTS